VNLFIPSTLDPSTWIKPTDRPSVFRTTGQRTDVTLAPLNTLFDTGTPCIGK
jgi:hypothetical protein